MTIALLLAMAGWTLGPASAPLEPAPEAPIRARREAMRDRGQDAKGQLAAAEQNLNRYIVDARLVLADWCKANGLPGDAVLHYTFVQKISPAGTPWRSKAERGLAGGWKDKPDSADSKAREEVRKRLDRYARESADRAFSCYRIARDGKMAAAPSWLMKTVEYDVDHPEAHKERKEIRIPAFGWVAEAEAEQWGDPLKSEHFHLRSDRADAAAALDRLERLHAAFFSIFGDRFRPPAEPIGVCWFRDPADVERIRAQAPAAPAPGTADFYNQLTQVCYVSGGLPTLLHEVTHALADLGAGGCRCLLLAAGRRADAPGNHWVLEGLACYFATIRFDGAEPAFPGHELRDDADIEPLLKLDAAGFHKELDRNYAFSEALVRRYMDGPKRARFLDFVRDFYAGRAQFPKELR